MLQFILVMRSRIEEFESSVCTPYEMSDANYVAWVITNFGRDAQELRHGIHYRRWIRTLHIGNTSDSLQLHNILCQLNGSGYVQLRNNIHRFSIAMQRMYKIFSENIHNHLLSPTNFVNPNDISKYISLLPSEMQDSIRIFYFSAQ